VAARATHGDATIIDEKSFDEKVIRFRALWPRENRMTFSSKLFSSIIVASPCVARAATTPTPLRAEGLDHSHTRRRRAALLYMRAPLSSVTTLGVHEA
jgi:hypothetical protein